MIYKNFKDKQLSLLGFGMMRLPLKEDKTIDQEQVNEMVDEAIKNGVNYFDTAYFYLDGKSEEATGIALKRYPRDSYYLATKYPGHELKEQNPKEVFENQLKNCGVDYFDFYLLHCVKEDTLDLYLDKEIGILDYFIEQKRLGRIKHLGFSNHSDVETLRKFLEATKGVMEFCQLQINYVDWTLQQGKEKDELLKEYNIPLWVMEPVRGGRIAKFNDDYTNRLKALRDESVPAFAFRFVQGIDNVGMILSGMSSLEQVKDNLKTFKEYKPLNDKEKALLFEIAEFVKKDVPCTGCKYCMQHCPMKIDIPEMIKHYNSLRIAVNENDIAYISNLNDDVKPSSCIGCGACKNICPQHIDVPDIMIKTNKIFEENK